MYGLTVISSLVGSKYDVINEAVNNIISAIEGGQIDGIVYNNVISGIDESIDGPCRVIMVEDVCTDEFMKLESLVSDLAAPNDIKNGVQFKKIVGTAVVNYGALNIFSDDDLLSIPADDLEMGRATHDLNHKPHMLKFGVNDFMINSGGIILTRETIKTLIENPRLRTAAGIDELIEQGLNGINMGMFAVGSYNNNGNSTTILHSTSPIFLAQWMKSIGVIVNYQSPFVSSFYGNNCGIGSIVTYQRMLINLGGEPLRLSQHTPAAEALQIKDLSSNYLIVTKFDYMANGCRQHVALPIAQFALSFSLNQVPGILRKASELR